LYVNEYNCTPVPVAQWVNTTVNRLLCLLADWLRALASLSLTPGLEGGLSAHQTSGHAMRVNSRTGNGKW